MYILYSYTIVRIPKTPLQMVQRDFTTLGVRQRGGPGQTQAPIPPLKQTKKQTNKHILIHIQE